MRHLLFLLSAATSLIRVDGRPQAPDLSKLPPGEGAVVPSREILQRGADGASLPETESPTEPPSATTDSPAADSAVSDSAATDSTDSPAADSAAAGTTESSESPNPELTQDEGQSADALSGGEAGDVGGSRSRDAERSSAGGESYSDGAASSAGSEDSVASPGGQEEVVAEESSTAAPFVTTLPPEPAVAETVASEPEVVETEAPKAEEVETEAPKQEVVEAEAPKPVVVETEVPGPAAAETEAPELTQSTEAVPTVTEPVAEATKETEEPATELDSAAKEEAAAEATPKLEESATEEPPTAEAVATEPALTSTARTTTEAASPTEAPQATLQTTLAAAPEPEPEPEPEVTAPGPEQDQSPVSSGGAEPVKVAAGEADDAAVEVADGATAGGAGEEEKTAKLELTALAIEPASPTDGNDGEAGGAGTGDDEGPAARPASSGGGDVARASQVELDEVYQQGVTSQIGRSSVLSKTVRETMSQVFLNPREVAYRLGRHTVNTYVTDLEVKGIDNMQIVDISSDVDEMSLNVTFMFPEITFTGRFNATGSILNRRKPGLLMLRTPFPSYGNGNIKATVANTTAVSQAELSHSFNDRKLSIELLTCRLTFGEPEVRLSEVVLPRALRKLHFERLFRMAVGKMISHQLATEIEPKVDESLHDVITSVLDQVSLDEAGATSFTSLGAGPDAWRTG